MKSRGSVPAKRAHSAQRSPPVFPPAGLRRPPPQQQQQQHEEEEQEELLPSPRHRFTLRSMPRITWIVAAWIVVVSVIMVVHMAWAPARRRIDFIFGSSTMVNVSFSATLAIERYDVCCRTGAAARLLCNASMCALHPTLGIAVCVDGVPGAQCALFLH